MNCAVDRLTKSAKYSNKTILSSNFVQRKGPSTFIFDLRSTNYYNRIPGAINIPYKTFCMEFKNYNGYIFDKEDTVLLYCQDGTFSNQVYKLLKNAGYDNTKILMDGFNGYLKGHSFT